MASASELQSLRRCAEELAKAAAGRREAERAGRLAARLQSGRFLLAVVGEFNRGKSTLVNALVGEAVLPTGVLPLTAVATELAFGEPSTKVVFLDGRAEETTRDRLAQFVTESGNPKNRLGVARVQLSGEWPLLRSGAVLVDTPGLASLYDHNSAAGRKALLDADGAIVVLSADDPMSAEERRLLRLLGERRSPTFLVLGKADHLSPEELEAVRRFVIDAIGEPFRGPNRVFAVDARSAGRDRAAGIEFADLLAALSRFVDDELLAALTSSARRELARLGTSLSEGLTIERAARQRGGEELAALVERFEAEVGAQRRGLEEDRHLLARDLSLLRDEVSNRLTRFVQSTSPRYAAALQPKSWARSRRELEEELQHRIQASVEEAFERCGSELRPVVEQEWRRAAERFRARVQSRVDSARSAAAHLFEVPLPALEIADLAEQPASFSFLFVRPEGMIEPLSRAGLSLLPARAAERRMLLRARRQLISEFDKHAGRMRWDIVQRLEAARAALERSSSAELQASIAAIAEGADRARRWQEKDGERREREERLGEGLEQLAESLVSLREEAGNDPANDEWRTCSAARPAPPPEVPGSAVPAVGAGGDTLR